MSLLLPDAFRHRGAMAAVDQEGLLRAVVIPLAEPPADPDLLGQGTDDADIEWVRGGG
jgi:hypothetical protein